MVQPPLAAKASFRVREDPMNGSPVVADGPSLCGELRQRHDAGQGDTFA